MPTLYLCEVKQFIQPLKVKQLLFYVEFIDSVMLGKPCKYWPLYTKGALIMQICVLT